MDRQQERERKLVLAARVAAAAVFTAAMADLVAWRVAPAFVVWSAPRHVPMVPVTALAFVLSATAIWLGLAEDERRRQLARILGGLVLALGMATLCEYIFHADLGVDRLPFEQAVPTPGAPFNGRAAPNTAVMFVFLGAALACLDLRAVRGFWPGEVFALAAAFFPYLAVLGYAYRMDALLRFAPFVGVSLQTACLALIACFGVLASRPRRGIVASLVRSDPGGLVRRRFWTAVLVALPALVALGIAGQRHGLYTSDVGLNGMRLVLMLLAFLLVESCARALDRLETERRSLVERLEKAVTEADDLYQHAPSAYTSLDADGLVVRMNDTGLRWLGYTRDEVVGKLNANHFMLASSRAAFAKSFARLKAEGSTDGAEYELVRKDGSTFWVVTSATAVTDDDGRFLCTRSVFHDISQRKAAELALRESEARLAESQRIARIGSWERDLSTQKMRWSDQLFRLMGFEPGSIEPTWALACSRFHPADRDQIEAVIDEAIRLHCPFHVSARMPQADGTMAAVHLQGEVDCDDEGRPQRLVGSIQDVTELRRIQEQLAKRTLDLEHSRELTKLKDRFLSNVSHELKTPLALVLGYAEMVEEKHPTDLSVRGLIEGGQRLADRVSAMVDYSALLAGSLPMATVELHPSEVLDNALAGIEAQAEHKGVRLERRIADGLPLVEVDPRRLAQALAEVLDNAVRFSPAGSRVIVELAAEGNEVCFAICDEGPGIPPADVAHIWNAFGTHEVAGLGLGLAIAKGIVELHHGRIAMEPNQPHGCRFTIHVPAVVEAAVM